MLILTWWSLLMQPPRWLGWRQTETGPAITRGPPGKCEYPPAVNTTLTSYAKYKGVLFAIEVQCTFSPPKTHYSRARISKTCSSYQFVTSKRRMVSAEKIHSGQILEDRRVVLFEMFLDNTLNFACCCFTGGSEYCVCPPSPKPDWHSLQHSPCPSVNRHGPYYLCWDK